MEIKKGNLSNKQISKFWNGILIETK